MSDLPLNFRPTKVLQHVPSVSFGEGTDPTNAAAHHERVPWVETTVRNDVARVFTVPQGWSHKVEVKWWPVENSQDRDFLSIDNSQKFKLKY